MKKRFLAALLCLCMVVTLLPTVAQAAKVYTGLEGWKDIEFSEKINVGSGVEPFTISNNENVYFYGSRTATVIPSVLGVGVRVTGEDTVANLFFYNCYLDLREDHKVDVKFDSPIEIADGASVNIYIAGTCTFFGDGDGTAAIHKQEAAGQLNIYVAEGATLDVTGGYHAAAIGGNALVTGTILDNYPEYKSTDGYNIAIGGPGTVVARGGRGAVAIGGGHDGKADNICIGMVNTFEFPPDGTTSGTYRFIASTFANGNPSAKLIGTTEGEYKDFDNIQVAIGENQHAWVTVNGNSKETAVYSDASTMTRHLLSVFYEAVISYEDCTKEWKNQKQTCTVCGKEYNTDRIAPVIGLEGGGKYTTDGVSLDFPVTDENSGVKNVSYAVGDAGAVTLTADAAGNYSVPILKGTDYLVIAIDNAGNVSYLSFHIRYVYTINFIADGKRLLTTEVLEDEALRPITIPAIPPKTGYDQTQPRWDVDTTDAQKIIKNADGSTLDVHAVYTINRYKITLPTGTGYKISPEGGTHTVDYGTDFSFSVNLLPGFGKAAHYAVKVDGTGISANDDGSYTIAQIDNWHTVTVEGVASTDAALSALTLRDDKTPIAVNETFTPTRTDYTAEVDYFIYSLTVIPTTNHALASVTVNGNAASERVLLRVGENEILVKVIAEDGLTEKTYTITVTRKPAPIGKPVLIFDTRGGDRMESISRNNLTTIDLSAYVPTRAGYSFTGWYADAALGERVTSICLTKNTTIYAGWTLIHENPQTGVGNPFADVQESDWFFDDVMFVFTNTLMDGTTSSTFSPDTTTTRAMVATILWRMEGSQKVTGSSGFTDVPEGKWYTDAITWAKQNNLVNGYSDMLFGPNDPVTREQLAAFFYRCAQHKGYDTTITASISSFGDSDKVSPWAVDAMKWAVGYGAIQGKPGNLLDPQGDATRAQLAAMLHRLINKNEPVGA